MEMERINENTIRVTIGNDDLLERGITFLDLLGNQKQIEAFFYSILEEVDVDEQFQGSDSVTFQVLPNRDGLELFISKNTVPNPEMDLNEFGSAQPDGFMDFLKSHIESDEEHEKTARQINYVETDDTVNLIFKVADFEDLILFATSTSLTNVLTSVYRYKDTYYLLANFLMDDSTDEELKNNMSVMYEYMTVSSVTPDILKEYGQVIIERNALSVLNYYFK